jgi:SMI1/KNR4 family protein SUKH-1
MSPSDFDLIVERARSSKIIGMSVSERPEPRVSEQELHAFEIQVGVSLPADFRHFAERYGCGEFAFITVLSLLPESDFFIGRSLHLVGPGFLPVIDNHCGDFYGFRVADGRCSNALYFADHEQSYELSDTDYPDFFSFVVREGLRTDETHPA